MSHDPVSPASRAEVIVPPTVPWGSEFAFGESPFQVKGVLYLGTVSYFERVHGGLERLLAVVDDPVLADFIAQPFISTALYDVMPVPALIAYEAIAEGKSLDRYLIDRTRWQAERDVGGVYKMLLRMANPETVIKRLPRILVQMFAFPDVEVETLGPGDREARFLHVPAPLEPWFRIAFPVYIHHTMTLAGAKDLAVEHRTTRPEDKRAGLRLVTMRMRVRWR